MTGRSAPRAQQPRSRVFFALGVIASLLLAYGLFEVGLYALARTKRIAFVSVGTLRGLAQDFPQTPPGAPPQSVPSASKPIYTPHPYFGFLYTPRNVFAQRNPTFGNSLIMTTNSEGFVDDEFPPARRADVVVYGLLGGSGAMSWGVEAPAERISSVLEASLNRHATDARLGKRFRVLNMGLGSFMQYQATQVFLYYSHLLDGVIFYSGNNEIAHGHILLRNDPVRFPLPDVLSALLSESPWKYEIHALRRDLTRAARGCLARGLLLRLPSVRWGCATDVQRLLKGIDDANRALEVSISRTPGRGLPFADPVRRELLAFDDSTDFLFHFSKRPEDVPLRRAIMEQIVPGVYTNPIIDAHAVARIRSIRFLNVLQPLMAGVDKPLSKHERMTVGRPDATKDGVASDAIQYQVTGLEVLHRQLETLQRHGIDTIDLNERNGVFHGVQEDVFIDPVHLNPAGARRVAEHLFARIRDRWLR